MKTARYADIKRFAVHDGPGIRSTLFLKGCPLACKWCHNPETISGKPELAIHTNKCVRCGECAQICSNHTVSATEHLFGRDNCIACGKCVEECLYGTLELLGKTISVEDAAKLLLEDKAFYAGNGGVTVSGGEPLLQADFCAELFQRLKESNISCAVDTCGNVPWGAFETVLPLTDFFLYDVKEIDPVKHQAFTGHDNSLILENLRRLDQTGKAIEVRMIMIPSCNMEPEDIAGAGKFLGTLQHVTLVRLLPYHSLAHAKYAMLDRRDTLPAVEAPASDMLDAAVRQLRQYRVNAVWQ